MDVKKGTITFRVLLSSPDPAVMRSLHCRLRIDERGARPAEVLLAGDDRVTTFELPDGLDPVCGYRVGFIGMMATGLSRSRALDRLLLHAADAVVLIPGPSRRRTTRTLRRIARFVERTGRGPADLPVFILDDTESVRGRPWQHVEALDCRVMSVKGSEQDAPLSVLAASCESLVASYRGLEARGGTQVAARAISQRQKRRALALAAEADPLPTRPALGFYLFLLAVASLSAIVAWTRLR